MANNKLNLFNSALLITSFLPPMAFAAAPVIMEPDNPHLKECNEIAKSAYRNCLDIAGGSNKDCKIQRKQTREDCNAIIQGAGIKSDDTRVYMITVSDDGRFTPNDLTIKTGDTVVWLFAKRTDTIIPIAATDVLPTDPRTGALLGALCTTYKPYNADDPNEFTGPLPRALSGIFLLNPDEPPYTINADLWDDSGFTGELIRLRWDRIHLGPDQYNWSVLDDQMTQAAKNGKVFSIAIKAGANGTPAWIFNKDILGAAAAKPLRLSDTATHQPGTSCGMMMKLGSPADPNYRTQYFTMLRAMAAHIKSRNAWYRALAYIKPSGANLYSAENRLPVHCWSPTGSGLTKDECNCLLRASGEPQTEQSCVCNPQILASGGYSPAAIREFYSLQTALIAREFPDKDMSYMLIQGGFPRINNAGEYEGQEVVNSLGEYLSQPDPARAPVFPLIPSNDQLNSILDDGAYEHGVRFLVQHNGLKMKPQFSGSAPCDQEFTHPVSANQIGQGHGCPNPYVLSAAARNGSITGFQTMNFSDIDTPEKLQSTLENAYDNSDAIFLEIYERMFSEWKNTINFPAWEEKFHERRRDEYFRDKAPDPRPYIHGHRFYYTKTPAGGEQILRYAHGSLCRTERPEIGTIRIVPNPR